VPVPRLSEEQTAWIIQQVAKYIEQQREAYKRKAAPLDSHQNSAMRPFFPASALDSARVLVLGGERVSNPPFYPELQRMGFDPAALPNFAFMAAITFVDTLGLQGFASKYVRGFLSGGSYEAIPLEINAYDLDARFVAAPTKAFSVRDEVQAWIDADQRFPRLFEQMGFIFESFRPSQFFQSFCVGRPASSQPFHPPSIDSTLV
jgi:hypothetical protein